MIMVRVRVWVSVNFMHPKKVICYRKFHVFYNSCFDSDHFDQLHFSPEPNQKNRTEQYTEEVLKFFKNRFAFESKISAREVIGYGSGYHYPNPYSKPEFFRIATRQPSLFFRVTKIILRSF